MLDLNPTRPSGQVIDEHRTSAAFSHSATEFRSGQIKVIPKDPEQAFIGFSLHSAVLSVDIQCEPEFCQFLFSRKTNEQSPFLLAYETLPVNRDEMSVLCLTY